MHECPDCGAPKRATMVLGFACQHDRCPMLSEILHHRSDEAKDTLRCETWEEREAFLETLRESDAVKKAMRRFWRRIDETSASPLAAPAVKEPEA